MTKPLSARRKGRWALILRKAAVRLSAFCTVMLMLCGHVHAGFSFDDPHIPDGESITYLSRSEGRTMTMRETVTVSREGENEYYDISSLSPVLDTFIRLETKKLKVVWVHTIQKYETATLDSKLIVRDQVENTKDDEIKVPHFVVLTHLLRGYPFDKRTPLKIGYYGGAAANKFTLCVKYKKRETVTVNAKPIECHKLEFGLDGFLGAVLPELELWYSVAPPHYLVRYHGPEGPPGTPKRFIELVDYSVPVQ